MALMFIQVQVVYRQGLIKTFIAPMGEILMDEFMKVVKAEGKVKAIRFLPDLDQATADLLVSTGNAVKVEMKSDAKI